MKRKKRGTPAPYAPPAVPTPPLQWFHGSYLIDLPAASPEVRRREFEKMLGRVEVVGVVDGPLGTVQAWVAAHNQRESSRVAGTPADTWTKLKLIVWRGCWCVRASQTRNKRRRSR